MAPQQSPSDSASPSFRLLLGEGASTFYPRVYFKLYVYSITLIRTCMCLETSGNGAPQTKDMDPLSALLRLFSHLLLVYFKDLPRHQMATELKEDYIAKFPYSHHVRNQITKIDRTLPSSFNGPQLTALTAAQIPLPKPDVH